MRKGALKVRKGTQKCVKGALKVRCRDTQNPHETPHKLGKLKFDKEAQDVWADGKPASVECR